MYVYKCLLICTNLSNFCSFFANRVRERDDRSYALSLSFKSQTKHYKIDKHMAGGTEKLAIEEGPRFESLMDVSGLI